MITVVQLVSGESLVTKRYVDNDDRVSLLRPIVCKVEQETLKMYPWPQFVKDPVAVMDIPKGAVVYSAEAEELVSNQYETLVSQWFGEDNE